MNFETDNFLSLFEEAEDVLEKARTTPSLSNSKFEFENVARNTLALIKSYNKINGQPMPQTYGDLAKIVKMKTVIPTKPEFKPMSTVEYIPKKMYSLVEQPIYALGEGSARALAAGMKAVGLSGPARYFDESARMWSTPPVTKDVNEQLNWLRDGAQSKGGLYAAAVDMAEIGTQIGSLLIQMGILAPAAGMTKTTSMLAGTAPLTETAKHMGLMFAHGMATTPGDLTNRFTAGVTRMAYNMTPFIANWTGATGWGARAVDISLNMFLTSPTYIDLMKKSKDPMDFIMKSLPQFMTDFVFALNTTGTPMNQRLKMLGQRPVVFGVNQKEAESFLRSVDKAIADTSKTIWDEPDEPTREQVDSTLKGKMKVKSAEHALMVLGEKTIEKLYKRVTAGEFPGIMLTKTESRQAMAKAKKAAKDAKINSLIEPILKGRVLNEYQKPQTVSDSTTIWDKLSLGLGGFHLGNMRAERLAGELDGFRRGANWEVIYKKPSDGVESAIRGELEGVEKFSQMLKSNNINLSTDPGFYTHKIRLGTDMDMTRSEIVETYLVSLDKDNLSHLMKPRELNGMGFTKDQLSVIKETVETTPNLKAIAEWRLAEYEANLPLIAAVYTKETGKEFHGRRYYVPLRVEKEYVDFEKDSIAEEISGSFGIKGYLDKGMTIAKKAGATQPLRLDFIDNYLYDLKRRQHYMNLALPLKELRGVMNDPKWRNAVVSTKGQVFYNNIKRYYAAVAGSNPLAAGDLGSKILSFFRVNAGTAMLGFNILTTLRQPLSVFQAMAEVGPSHVLSAFEKMARDTKGMEEFIHARSKLVRDRRGHFERFTGEAPSGALELLGQKKAPKALTGKKGIKELALLFPVIADKFTVDVTWLAAYDKVQMTGKTLEGEKINPRDLERIAIREGDAAVSNTQPMTGAKDLPSWHRDSRVLSLFTMFQNQVNQNYNYFAYDIIGKARAGKLTPALLAQKVLFAYILPAMALGMMSRGRLPIQKKDIAEDLVTYPLSGAFFIGGIINSIVREYSSYGVPPLQFAADLVSAGVAKKWPTRMRYGIKGIAEATGIPYSQLYRTWQGTKALLEGDTDDWRRLIWSEYALTKGLPKKKKVTYGAKRLY